MTRKRTLGIVCITRYLACLSIILVPVFILIFLGTNRQMVADMVNDYYPYVDFKILQAEIKPRHRDNLFLLVLINSGATAKYRERRDIIRKTWGNQDVICDQYQKITFPWKLVFVVGKSDEENDNLNKEEAMIYDDMLIGDIEENYINNINKLFMGISWISTLSNVSYILKTDDDVYIKISQVFKYIVEKDFPKPIYAGASYIAKRWRGVNRNPNNKWGLSRRYYDDDVWPPFNPGAFILISQDTIHGLLGYIPIQKPFHMDDAYLGMAFNAMNIYPTKLRTFVIGRDHILIEQVLLNKRDCFLKAVTAIGHNIEPKHMLAFHKRMQEFCSDKVRMEETKPCRKQLKDRRVFNV